MRFQERSELDIYYKPKNITKNKSKPFHISSFPFSKVPVPARANYFTRRITVFERTMKYSTHDALTSLHAESNFMSLFEKNAIKEYSELSKLTHTTLIISFPLREH